jgi:hypothetical protein
VALFVCDGPFHLIGDLILLYLRLHAGIRPVATAQIGEVIWGQDVDVAIAAPGQQIGDAGQLLAGARRRELGHASMAI